MIARPPSGAAGGGPDPMSECVYLNGEYVPLSEARVPVLDRGFMFGDGVYEVIPAYARRPFRLQHHLQRLDASLHAIRLDNPLSFADWEEIIGRVIADHPASDQSIYVQVTRGPARRDHGFPADPQPTVLVMSSALSDVPEAVAREGVAAVTLPDIRWGRCDIKAITLLPNILLRQQALDAGAAEAILLREGRVTEGAASNVFVVIGGVLITPPKSRHLLPGITRDLVVQLAQAHQVSFREGEISEAELRGADEVWLTSSTKEILPVTRLDGLPVGDGTPGPLWETLLALYQAYKRGLRRGSPG